MTDQQEDNIEQEDALVSDSEVPEQYNSELPEVDYQDLMQEFFRDKHYRKKILFSKNMGGKKHRDFYIMETSAGASVALVVHDNWKGNVRSLSFYNMEEGKDFQP